MLLKMVCGRVCKYEWVQVCVCARVEGGGGGVRIYVHVIARTYL